MSKKYENILHLKCMISICLMYVSKNIIMDLPGFNIYLTLADVRDFIHP